MGRSNGAWRWLSGGAALTLRPAHPQNATIFANKARGRRVGCQSQQGGGEGAECAEVAVVHLQKLRLSAGSLPSLIGLRGYATHHTWQKAPWR